MIGLPAALEGREADAAAAVNGLRIVDYSKEIALDAIAAVTEVPA